MRIAVYSTKPYDRRFLEAANTIGHELVFLEARLTADTAFAARDAQAVCIFVNDEANSTVLAALQAQGVALVALRCAGFNNVDLTAAQALGMTVCRVPAYSPHAVAEHTLALILALNRNTHRAYNRVREGNFSLDGLLGFDLHGKTLGVVGTGTIGATFLGVMSGFGMTLLAHDPQRNPACVALGVEYVNMPELLSRSDVISLHCPLTPATRHLIDDHAVRRMKRGAMLINTSRGAVVDTPALVEGLKSGAIGALGLDVYEEEADLFFENLSDQVLQDDVFARLLTFPNVLITSHQGFFTTEALTTIAEVTLANVTSFADSGTPLHQVSTERLA